MWEYKKITNNINNKNETKFKFLINKLKKYTILGWRVWEEAGV